MGKHLMVNRGNWAKNLSEVSANLIISYEHAEANNVNGTDKGRYWKDRSWPVGDGQLC